MKPQQWPSFNKDHQIISTGDRNRAWDLGFGIKSRFIIFSVSLYSIFYHKIVTIMYLSLKILCFASSNPQITNTDCWGCDYLSFFPSEVNFFVWYSLPKRNDPLASVACIYSELILFYHALCPWLIFCFVDCGFYVFLGFLKLMVTIRTFSVAQIWVV